MSLCTLYLFHFKIRVIQESKFNNLAVYHCVLIYMYCNIILVILCNWSGTSRKTFWIQFKIRLELNYCDIEIIGFQILIQTEFRLQWNLFQNISKLSNVRVLIFYQWHYTFNILFCHIYSITAFWTLQTSSMILVNKCLER